MSPGKAIKVLLATSDNMKECFRIKKKGAIRTSCHILTCREGVVNVADGKIVNVLG